MNFLKKYSLYIAWTASLLAMLGSLYYSNILHYAPCVLCWYQRICIYPLVVILGIGILRRDRNVVLYALPLSVIGGLISLYHNLLYYKILPESAAPCTVGASCLTKYVEYFGFVSIPLLSLLTLIIITVCLLIAKKYDNQ